MGKPIIESQRIVNHIFFWYTFIDNIACAVDRLQSRIVLPVCARLQFGVRELFWCTVTVLGHSHVPVVADPLANHCDYRCRMCVAKASDDSSCVWCDNVIWNIFFLLFTMSVGLCFEWCRRHFGRTMLRGPYSNSGVHNAEVRNC